MEALFGQVDFWHGVFFAGAVGSAAGFAMVLSLLISAILWNLGA